MGKGGVSGTIDFPQYIKDIHEDWMTGGVLAPFDVGVDTIMANSMDEQTVFANSGTDLFDNFNPTSPAAVLGNVDTRYDVLDAKVKALIPKGDWCEYIKEAVKIVDECVSKDIDSNAIVTKSLADATSLIDKFFKDIQVDHGIVPVDDYNTHAGAAVARADLVGVLNSINFTTLKSGQIADIKTVLDAAKVEKAGHSIVEVTDWESWMDSVKTKVDTAGILNAINFTTLKSGQVGDLNIVIDAAKAEKAGHGIIETTDWEAWVDSGVTKADLTDVLKTIDLPALLIVARSGADSEITDAIAAAQAAAVGTILTNLKNAYETRQESTVANQVRRFMGGMIDSNSIHGSSFVMGLALIYSDHQRDVGDFHTTITRDAFVESIQLHVRAYLGQLSEEVRADSQEKQARDTLVLESARQMSTIQNRRIGWEQELIVSGIQLYTSLIGAGFSIEDANKTARDTLVRDGVGRISEVHGRRIAWERGMIDIGVQLYQSLVNGGFSVEQANKVARDQFVLKGIDSMSQILALSVGYEQQILQIFALAFARHAEVHLRSLMGNKASRDSFVGQGVEVMAQMLARQIQSEETTTRLLSEIGRLRIVTTREFEAWEFDVAKRRAMWNLDIYTMGGAMLGAPAGMSAVLPKEPSAAASVLSGALGGAAIGSMIPIPGVSTAVGAGLGAILGGLGGAL